MTNWIANQIEVHLMIHLHVDRRLQAAWIHSPELLTLDNGEIQAGIYDYEN